MDSQETMTEQTAVVSDFEQTENQQGIAEVAAYVPPSSARRKWNYFIHNWELYAMLLPGMASLIIFAYGPMFGLYLAFINYDDLTYSMFDASKNAFAGWRKFQYMWAFGLMKYVKNTLILSSLKLFVGFPMPIILAILINEVNNKVFKSVFQTISYLPNFISWVVVAGIIKILLETDSGLFNKVARFFGGEGIAYYSTPGVWRPILLISSIWKGVGYSSITYLAILTSIDPQLFEAAMIDGANRFKQILHITIPGLAGIISINFIMSVGSVFGDDVEQAMTIVGDNAAVREKTELLGTYIYRNVMGGAVSEYPVSSAMGLCQSLCSLVLILTTNYAASKLGAQSVW